MESTKDQALQALLKGFKAVWKDIQAGKDPNLIELAHANRVAMLEEMTEDALSVEEEQEYPDPDIVIVLHPGGGVSEVYTKKVDMGYIVIRAGAEIDVFEEAILSEPFEDYKELLETQILEKDTE